MVAEGAQAACELYRSDQAPEITLSDFRLGGGINGIEAVQMLSAAAGRRITACLISGDTDANVRQQAQEAGLTLLQKPVRPAKLRSLKWRYKIQHQQHRLYLAGERPLPDGAIVAVLSPPFHTCPWCG